MTFVEDFSLKRPFSLSRVGKIASRGGVENRGSLIGVPLALRGITCLNYHFLAVPFGRVLFRFFQEMLRVGVG